MAISLIVEVLDYAPLDLTQAELVVLVVLAEQAREDTRECWPGMDLICHRSRLKEDSVRRVFQRLAARGLEVRVPVGKSKGGQPVYAHHGARTLYRIPRFAPSPRSPRLATDFEAGTTVPPSTTEAGTVIPPSSVERRDDGPTKPGRGSRKGGSSSREAGTSVPPFPSVPQAPSPPSPASRSTPAVALSSTPERGREGSEASQEQHHAASALLDGLDLGRALTTTERRRLLAMATRKLADGWSSAALRDAIDGRWNGAGDRVAVLHSRFKDLSEPSAQSGIPMSPRPAWCGQCDQTTRQIEYEHDDGRPVIKRCPNCHPEAKVAPTEGSSR